MDKNVKKKYNNLIVASSIIIPLVVAILFGINLREMGLDVKPLSFLPPIYASINGFTAILLIIAVIAIKKGKMALHKSLMKLAMLCSVLFLVMYVAYHMTSDSTKYGGDLGIIYYPILISHIFLSVAIIPLVLITYVRALSNRFNKHKKIAKITYPIWLYVAITGVLVYLMISPYYVK